MLIYPILNFRAMQHKGANTHHLLRIPNHSSLSHHSCRAMHLVLSIKDVQFILDIGSTRGMLLDTDILHMLDIMFILPMPGSSRSQNGMSISSPWLLSL